MFAAEAATSSNGMSQKTYEIGFSFPCELRAERLSRKNGRGTLIWVPRYFDFQEEKL